MQKVTTPNYCPVRQNEATVILLSTPRTLLVPFCVSPLPVALPPPPSPLEVSLFQPESQCDDP